MPVKKSGQRDGVRVKRDGPASRKKGITGKSPVAGDFRIEDFVSPVYQMVEGYQVGPAGLFVKGVVEPSAIKKGIEKAKEQIRSVIDGFAGIVVADGHRISEIELSVSFDVSGKFLGIGVGGATSIKVKIVPSR